ncbi:MAG: hypothetical protein N2490_07695 [Ignavibacteria bacterium]|nr:hypothetical protein [Ignavibacteria bacterium]
MNKNYLLYLLDELEKELFIYAGNSRFGELIKLINLLKSISETENRNDLIKYSYLLLKTKNFEKLGSYLLFIIKKTEEDIINFENLNDNLLLDKEFLKNFLLSVFKIVPEKSKTELETDITQEDSETIMKSIQESKEVYETLESEFLRSTVGNITSIEQKDKEGQKHDTTSIKKENEHVVMEEEHIVEDTTLEKESNLTLISNEYDSTTEKIYDLPEEGEIADLQNKTEFTKQGAEKEEESGMKIKRTLKTIEEDRIQINDTKKEGEEELSKKEIKKKIYIDHFEEDFSELEEKENIKLQTENIKREKEYIKEENTAFKKYESEVYTRNLIISEALGKIRDEMETLGRMLDERESDTKSKHSKRRTSTKTTKVHTTEKIDFKEEEKKENILSETIKNILPYIRSIVSECEFMEKQSKEISFEIITNIYHTISETMKRFLEDVEVNKERIVSLTKERIDLFLKSIILVRKLITGEDFSGYENVVAEMEQVRNNLIREKEEIEKKKRLAIEKEEIEKKLTEKYSDLSQRRKLLILKERILNVENVFKSLETIEGEYQIYNALTTLSKTFNYFRDIVKLSKELKIENMAKLSEASYIFIKFIQNYRMDPLSKDIKEILNYIVVNMKLLFLDKKTKDFELFISYLNNPERIFT